MRLLEGIVLVSDELTVIINFMNFFYCLTPWLHDQCGIVLKRYSIPGTVFYFWTVSILWIQFRPWTSQEFTDKTFSKEKWSLFSPVSNSTSVSLKDLLNRMWCVLLEPFEKLLYKAFHCKLYQNNKDLVVCMAEPHSTLRKQKELRRVLLSFEIPQF